MNRSVLRKIAREHGVSVAEVKREIQAAIDAAYANPSAAALAVPRRGAIPTPEEFVDYCAAAVAPCPSKVHTLH